MNFLLQNSGFVWLAALIAVPPLIHLFARSKPPKFLFSATTFVAQVVKDTLRIKRPKDILLLIIRTLLFVALAFLFLRPLLFTKGLPEDSGSPRTVLMIVDTSASMAWSEGGQSRFAAACAEASEVLDDLSTRDYANIIWLDAQPDALFPEFSPNIKYLRNRLSEARMTSEAGDPTAALELALVQLKSAKGIRELCIVSDFQAAQWKNVDFNLPDDINVFTIWPVNEEAENGTVLSLETIPIAPLVGEPAQIVCEVGNFSDKPRTRTVSLQIGEKRTTKNIMIPAWGRGSATLEHIFKKEGPVILNAQLDEDLFGFDDWRGTIITVKKAMNIGIYGNDQHSAPIWQRALDAIPWTEATIVKEENITDVLEYDLLMLAGWDGSHAELLSELNKNGLSIVCCPAEGLPLKNLLLLAGSNKGGGDIKTSWQKLDEAVGMNITAPEHPAFSLFRNSDFGDPAKSAFSQRLTVPLKNIPGSPILSFNDGVPALYLCDKPNPLLIWLTPLDSESSDWSAQAPFLPFFGELIGSIRSTPAGSFNASILPGESLSWSTPSWTENVSLMDSRNNKLSISQTESSSGGSLYISDPITKPGIYHWYIGDESEYIQAVTFPANESDLRTTAPALMKSDSALTVSRSEDLKAAREGKPLWKTLAWLALLFVGTETIVVLLCDLDSRKLAGEIK